MFEDKRRKRRRRYILLMLLFLFMAAAFGIGYYFNTGDPTDILKEKDEPEAQLKIPDSLLNPATTRTAAEETGEPQDSQAASNIPDEAAVSPGTTFVFRTRFTLCGHMIEKTAAASDAEVNLTEAALQEKYAGWTITRFTVPLIEMERNIATHCPKHYILGISNGNIAVYQYDEDGKKNMIEETDISIETLTPEDQKSLESGIIADTEDDLNLKLEGFSD